MDRVRRQWTAKEGPAVTNLVSSIRDISIGPLVTAYEAVRNKRFPLHPSSHARGSTQWCAADVGPSS